MLKQALLSYGVHFPRSFFFLHSPSSSSSSSSSSTLPLLRTLRISSFSSIKMAGEEEKQEFKFGPYKIHKSEVFYATNLSYAMVNLRPLLPGHVLICPKREVKRFVDLTAEETSDLWLTAQKIGNQLESYHKASSLTFAIQDGPQAGQTVPHVHIHVVPRRGGDFEKNDEIYDAMDEKEKELKEKLDLDKERKDRSFEEMTQEADEYRKLFL
ncbi:bifunctional bis(5'-adenosyl)-triphosphatase/adenylylsulfatase FHIT [Arachis ipaensis]|uniref:bifunctional bis(5'-adenosyl)-triphosphatase/adenylylsulfatase FHIT n=1 Tax=Arachis ipaensis TaxID=130454 RepID=UPI0007AF7449|nr:bifunctional bis(5'-adenosyl)-triphosphatase/adenylylsulfatase FHIT [Arachis ipaensis]XP_025626349.1 bifunctional bis(5'-adenosyl)-triphosphatase/adenylylsulfatase FHIT [Arachis hypogaea]